MFSLERRSSDRSDGLASSRRRVDGRVVSLASLSLAAIVTSSCATSYQPTAYTGGYRSRWTAPEILTVEAHGNAYSSPDRIRDFANLRAAELTRLEGQTHFSIVSENHTTQRTNVGSLRMPAGQYAGSVSIPLEAELPSTVLRIRLHRTPPANVPSQRVFDASEVIARLGPKYLADARTERPTTVPGMVNVPGGEFLMGCNEHIDKECYRNEPRSFRSTADAFLIDRTEVTVAAYRQCVESGCCSANGVTTALLEGRAHAESSLNCNWNEGGRDHHPMNCVNWEQARQFCACVGKRLPTSAEWEKAARGPSGRKYPWGNERLGRVPVANIADESAKRKYTGTKIDVPGYDDGYAETAPVGTYSPGGDSVYGAADMVGNVVEWNATWYPKYETRGTRGGGWRAPARKARPSMPYGDPPDTRTDDIGFRCAQ